MEMSFSKERTHEFVNNTLQAIANLSLKETLRAHILYNKGIEVFLAHLRNERNTEG